jgi:hypothetical protein
MVTIERVTLGAAQELADECEKVVYVQSRASRRWGYAVMTTDRDEAVTWGQFTAIAPVLTEQQHDAEMLGANLRVLAEEAGLADAFMRTDLPRPPKGWWQRGEQTWVARDALKPVDDDYMNREPDPEPQLRVVRVLELRGPREDMEDLLADAFVNPSKPRTFKWRKGMLEIVEQIRMRTLLCRWCGEDHLDRQSEDNCGANPRKGRY